MQAKIAREGEIVVIHLAGRVDVETAEPFRNACLNHLGDSKVVFDFKSLSFVGSSGILPFLETMQEFAKTTKCGFKFSGVGSEFRKVFAATPLNVVEIYETPAHAIHAFHNPPPATQAVQAAPLESDRGAESFGFLTREPRAETESESFEVDPDVDQT